MNNDFSYKTIIWHLKTCALYSIVMILLWSFVLFLKLEGLSINS